MPSFKDILANDVNNIFMNKMEFAEIHNVNGKPMKVIMDDNEQIEREKGSIEEGIFTKKKLIYVSAKEFGALPAVDAVFKLDKKLYRVADAINEAGIYSITLEATGS